MLEDCGDDILYKKHHIHMVQPLTLIEDSISPIVSIIFNFPKTIFRLLRS